VLLDYRDRSHGDCGTVDRGTVTGPGTHRQMKATSFYGQPTRIAGHWLLLLAFTGVKKATSGALLPIMIRWKTKPRLLRRLRSFRADISKGQLSGFETFFHSASYE
jgi:hypothetical protein